LCCYSGSPNIFDANNAVEDEDPEDHDMYLNPSTIDDMNMLDCHTLDLATADDCCELVPKREYVHPQDDDDDDNDDDDDEDNSDGYRRNFRQRHVATAAMPVAIVPNDRRGRNHRRMRLSSSDDDESTIHFMKKV